MKEPIILFDLDGTMVDYDNAIKRDYYFYKNPNDPHYSHENKKISHLRKLIDLIRCKNGWWLKLTKNKLGFDIYNIAIEIGYKPTILSKAPRNCPNAYTEKYLWVKENIGDIDVIISPNKTIVDGLVLVDDYPKFVDPWLNEHPDGIAILPKNENNDGYSHQRAIIYDGSNITEVKCMLISHIQKNNIVDVNVCGNHYFLEPTIKFKWISKMVLISGGNNFQRVKRLHQWWVDKNTGNGEWIIVDGLDEKYL